MAYKPGGEQYAVGLQDNYDIVIIIFKKSWRREKFNRHVTDFVTFHK